MPKKLSDETAVFYQEIESLKAQIDAQRRRVEAIDPSLKEIEAQLLRAMCLRMKALLHQKRMRETDV